MPQTVSCSEAGLARAREAVIDGRVIVFPTDTVYGLGCDPYNTVALDRIYDIKGRPRRKGLPVLGLRRDIEKAARLDGVSAKMADAFWPGPVTLILPLRDKNLAGSLGSVDAALREPFGDCAHRLLAACGLLIGTSANASGGSAPSSPDQCNLQGYDLLVDGGRTCGEPSTIVDCARGRILRRGAVATEVERML